MGRGNAIVRYYSSITAKEIDWLWYPYIPFGRITIIQGDSGEGKTTFALNLAARLSDNEYPSTLNDDRLEQAIIISNARLLILDSLQVFIGDNTNMHRASNMRPLLQKLSDIVERTACAVIIIGHMNKASGSKGLYRGLGSIDIASAARSVLLNKKNLNIKSTKHADGWYWSLNSVK